MIFEEKYFCHEQVCLSGLRFERYFSHRSFYLGAMMGEVYLETYFSKYLSKPT